MNWLKDNLAAGAALVSVVGAFVTLKVSVGFLQEDIAENAGKNKELLQRFEAFKDAKTEELNELKSDVRVLRSKIKELRKLDEQ